MLSSDSLDVNMLIHTRNCPRDLRPVTFLALRFFEKTFFDETARKYTEVVNVCFDRQETKEDIAIVDFEDEFPWRRPREYDIVINDLYRDIKLAYYVPTLFHEMTHIRQYATGKLTYRVSRHCEVYAFGGVKYDDEVNYFELPWEHEAFGIEYCAWQRFLQAYPQYQSHIISQELLGRGSSKKEPE